MTRAIHLRLYQEINGGLRLFLDEHNMPILQLKAGDIILSIELNPARLHDIGYFVAQCFRLGMDAAAPHPEPVRVSAYVEDQGNLK